MNPIATIASEWAHARGSLSVLRRLRSLGSDPTRTLREEVEEWAAAWKERPALLCDGESLTYAELFGRANRWARWAILHGVGKGDRVALLMPDRPEHLAAWLGIAMVGGIAALMPTNTSGIALADAVAAVRPRAVVVDTRLLALFETAAPHLVQATTVWVWGAHTMAYQRIDEALAEMSPVRLFGRDRRPLLDTEDCLWIVASGTSGTPEIARLDHRRVSEIMITFAAAARSRRDDRICVAQPMCGTAGAVLAPGIVLTVGGACVLRGDTAAATYWSDVVRWGCTLMQYDGDLCRDLLAAPPSPDETRHHLRLAGGTGLAADARRAFRARFRVPRTLEWFASADGTVLLIDFEGRPGSVGRIPFWSAGRKPIRLLRLDPTTGGPLRDPRGGCLLARDGEPGEAIGEIVASPQPGGKRSPERHDGPSGGRVDAPAAEATILRDVVRPGDAWIRTGDLLVRDRRGRFRFVGRVGDIGGRKGEDAATPAPVGRA